ncbi:MAG: FkbM family methyltransferase [Spirulina sp.]
MIPDLIYDVGMNQGEDTAYYLSRNFKVLAIEADSELADRAKQRFHREIATGQLILLNVAIAETEGILPFWICESHSEWSSFSRESASRHGSPHHAIEVTCRPFLSILEEYGTPYYLKIDIEGYDRLCLEALNPHYLPQYISVEKGKETFALLPKLKDLGYADFKLISQFNYLALEIKPIAEQKYFAIANVLVGGNHLLARACQKFHLDRRVRKWLHWLLLPTSHAKNWSFAFGSSGPLSEETLGRWQTFSEIVETCHYYDELFQKRKPSLFWDINREDSFWADFHISRAGN